MSICTYDIFDTLIARRCVIPTAIFDIVQSQIIFDNYKEIRILSEQNIINNNYTFNDIYDEFQKITNLDINLVNEIKQFELNVELDNCIPIMQNLNKVNNGDILVSDMYHSQDFIFKLLEKCGLTKKVTIIVNYIFLYISFLIFFSFCNHLI